MSQIWRGVSGGIEVLENVNEMADLPDISTIDSEGVWYIESGGFGPDYIAPTNWDSSAGEFTDWFSLFDGQILANIPNSVVDNFEEEPDGPYGDTDDLDTYYSTQTATASFETETVFEGSRALDLTHSDGSDFIISDTTDGLPNYPARPAYLRVAMYDDSGVSLAAMFGVQDSSNFYAFGSRPDSNELRLWKDGVGGGDVVASEEVTLSQDTWYIYECDWNDNGTIEIRVLDSDENELGSLSHTDEDYSDGGIGFLIAGGGTAFYDDYLTST